jgi:hypothetical protein
MSYSGYGKCADLMPKRSERRARQNAKALFFQDEGALGVCDVGVCKAI